MGPSQITADTTGFFPEIQAKPPHADGPPLIAVVYGIVTHMKQADNQTSTSVLSVRVSEAERQLLQDASDEARTNISQFVRRKAIEAAELQLMGAAHRHHIQRALGPH